MKTNHTKDEQSEVRGIVEEIDTYLDNTVHSYCDYLIYSDLKDMVAHLQEQHEREKQELVEIMRQEFYKFNDSEEDFKCNQRVLKLRNKIQRTINKHRTSRIIN